MENTFVSHASDDRYFVNLLVAILEHHEIYAWCSFKNVPVGTRYRRGIVQGIENSEAMLVVISRNALKTPWITQEVTAFQQRDPEAPVAPRLLDATSVDDVYDGLSEFQSIDFSECMLTGFQCLFKDVFNASFLPRPERRTRAERRNVDVERREDRDRRQAPLFSRMSKGFWIQFSEAFALGKHQEMPIGVSNLEKTVDALLLEAKSYEFKDSTGRPVDPRDALSIAARDASQRIGRGTYPVVAPINFVEGIARYLTTTLGARLRETRRDEDDRRARDRRKWVSATRKAK